MEKESIGLAVIGKKNSQYSIELDKISYHKKSLVQANKPPIAQPYAKSSDTPAGAVKTFYMSGWNNPWPIRQSVEVSLGGSGKKV